MLKLETIRELQALDPDTREQFNSALIQIMTDAVASALCLADEYPISRDVAINVMATCMHDMKDCSFSRHTVGGEETE